MIIHVARSQYTLILLIHLIAITLNNRNRLGNEKTAKLVISHRILQGLCDFGVLMIDVSNGFIQLYMCERCECYAY